MTIALKFENDDILWLDAVTNYGQSLTGRVTEHPVEDGTVISDTVIKEAPAYSLAGVISNADFHFDIPLDTALDVINNVYLSPVEIRGNKPSPLSKYIPEGVSAFIPTNLPTVVVDERNVDVVSIARNRIEAAHQSGESVTLVEYERGTVKKSITGLYFTNISFSETADTGDALEFSFGLQKVIKVTLEGVVTGAVAVSKGDNGGSKGGKTGTTDGDVSADTTTAEIAEGVPDDKSLFYQFGAGALKIFTGAR